MSHLCFLPEVATINPRGWTNPPTDDELVSFVPMKEVEELSGRMNASIHRNYGEVKKGFTRFEEEDVLFAKITPSMENGKCALATGLENGRGVGTTEFHVLRPGPRLSPKYLMHFLLQSNIREDARSVMRGVAGQLRVPKEFFETVKIPVPSLTKQQAIVDEIETQFARLDDAESALRHAEVRLDKLRVSGIDKAIQNTPDSDLNLVLLGELVELAEYGTSIKCDYDFTGPPVLRIPNVAKGRIELADLKYSSEELKSEKSLSDGDILIIRTNGSKSLVGRSAVYRNLPTDKYWFASYLLRFRLKPESIRPEWLYWILESAYGRNWIDTNAASSAGQHNISVSKLKGFALPLPSIETQDQIIAHLQREDSLIEQLKLTVDQSAEKIASLRQAILKNAFEGNYGQ